jgi:hypothetical protein
MKKDHFKDHAKATIVQNHQVNKSNNKISEIYSTLTEIEKRQNKVIESNKEFLDDFHSLNTNFDMSDDEFKENLIEIEKELALMSKREFVSSVNKLDTMNFSEDMSWDDYLAEIGNYANRNEINLDLEFERMFAFEEIDFVQLNKGIDPIIICIDGFLTENEDGQRWFENLPDEFKKHTILYLKWESQSFLKMAKEQFNPQLETLLKKTIITDFFENLAKVWFKATNNAEKAGKSLAGLIHNEKKDFILIGHSLGSRVIHSCLESLSLTDKCNIIDIYLLGGAVKNDYSSWINESELIQGNIYNFLSEKDRILQIFYKMGEGYYLKFDKPIGRNIISVDKIKNVNASNIIDSHMVYHENFKSLLKLL